MMIRNDRRADAATPTACAMTSPSRMWTIAKARTKAAVVACSR